MTRHESIGLAKRYAPHGKPASHVSALAGTRSVAGSRDANKSRLGVSGGYATSFAGVIVPPTARGYARINISTGQSVTDNFPLPIARDGSVEVLPAGIARSTGQNKPAFSVKTEADAIAHAARVKDLQAELAAIKVTAKVDGTPLSLIPRVRQIRHELAALGVSGKGKAVTKGLTPEQSLALAYERKVARAEIHRLELVRAKDALEAAILVSATESRREALQRNAVTGEITPSLSSFVDDYFTRLHSPSTSADGTPLDYTDIYLLRVDSTGRKDLRQATSIIRDAVREDDETSKHVPSIPAILAYRSRETPMTRNSTRNVKHVKTFEALRNGKLRSAILDPRTGQVSHDGPVMLASKGYTFATNNGNEMCIQGTSRAELATSDGYADDTGKLREPSNPSIPAITGGILTRPYKYPAARNQATDHGQWSGIVSSGAPNRFIPNADVSFRVIGDAARKANAAMRAMRP